MAYYMTQRAQASATAAAECKKRREMARAAAATANPRAPLAIKHTGRYEKIEPIGSGAFGVVYRAHDRHTGEVVAMKCLSAYRFDAPHLDSIFADEVCALEACRGLPCVVQLRDSCRRDPATGEAFIVMELVGPSLKDATTRGGRSGGLVRRHTEGEVRQIVRQLLTGAAAMHGVGLMHRDIKPDNVLFGAGGSLKICDLGKARAVADDPPYSNPIVARNYRAPELLLGCADYDAGVDTWAIGCIMAELLAGSLLFDGGHSSTKEHLSEVLNVLGTNDIKEWSRCPDRLPSGCGPTSFLRDLFPSSHDLAMAIGRPALSGAGFEVLSGLLRCNPEKRMTAACALKQRWFDEAEGVGHPMRRARVKSNE